ncbi:MULTISPECIES: hypothetical protein [Bacillus]|uniref:hypothetical protein n=1 Tax=Bacillus TaxID=1386 RepID=UPI0004191BA8|nr:MULTISPECIES: hypothetical protein [Bacillus]WFA05748.1 hypothetical protein P3X63_02545 [Bacillus sp. HSf4]
MTLRLPFCAVLFILLAVLSNLLFLYVFHQGVPAFALAIVFLLLAAYCTTRSRVQK